jgi:hypothetical protein
MPFTFPGRASLSRDDPLPNRADTAAHAILALVDRERCVPRLIDLKVIMKSSFGQADNLTVQEGTELIHALERLQRDVADPDVSALFRSATEIVFHYYPNLHTVCVS